MAQHSSENRESPARCVSAPAAQISELSLHLLRAQEEERRRISRELHDGTGQGLMVLRLFLGMLASESHTPESQAKVQEALKLLDHTIEDLRRIIGRLSPRVLEEMGLLAAIRKSVRDVSRSTGLKSQVDLPKVIGDLDREIELALYRSLQEALHNITKHAQAQNFKVLLQSRDHSVCLMVEDDGVGFSGGRRSRNRAFGLLGMKQRIGALGGKVRISSRKGSGTRIKITIPSGEKAGHFASPLSHGAGRLVAFGNSDSELEPGEIALAPR
jgi:signal transduction histidine kinase